MFIRALIQRRVIEIAIEVRACMCNYIRHKTMGGVTYLCTNLNLNM